MARLRMGGPAVRQHLKICEHCRSRYWDMLNAGDYPRMISDLPLKKQIHSLEIGQIRKILDKAVQPINEKLFSPPLVAIIKIPNSKPDFVRVVQLHDEPELAGPGDVAIELPCQTFYAESWNTYPILAEFLGAPLTAVSEEIVGNILKEEEKPLPEVPEDSPIEVFRELEVEVGYHYSQLSVAMSLEKMYGNEKEVKKAGIINFSSAKGQGFASHNEGHELSPLEKFIEKKAQAQLKIGFPFVGGMVAGAAVGLFAMGARASVKGSTKEVSKVSKNADPIFIKKMEKSISNEEIDKGTVAFFDKVSKTQIKVYDNWAFAVSGSRDRIFICFIDDKGEKIHLCQKGLKDKVKDCEVFSEKKFSIIDGVSDFAVIDYNDVIEIELENDKSISEVRFFV